MNLQWIGSEKQDSLLEEYERKVFEEVIVWK